MVTGRWLAGALLGTCVFVWVASGGWNRTGEDPPATQGASPGSSTSTSLSAEQRLEIMAPRQEPLHLIPRTQPYGPSLVRGQ
jgi:hypothetical protein